MNLVPIAPQTTSAAGVRCRPDLVFVETKHKHESAFVAKDPVSLKYHRLRPDEFFVLRILDGETSLNAIQEQYEQRFAPNKVSLGQLNQLLFSFHKNGLTVSDAMLQGDRLAERCQDEKRQRMMQHISGVLFIRFPGVDPEPFLRRLYPMVRPFLGWTGALLAAVLCIVAFVTLLTQWPAFMADMPQMNHWLRPESLIILMLVIFGTKVLHELGHAIACRHFGGECHQIGPMLLVFAPALYCDTSDSWMLPNRFQRAAVGLAGIATEILLAAIATLVWVSTAPGLVHMIAMNVMLVCSVSTVLFNANPLLRYDGYYVLSDLCDVPNLGQHSQNALMSRFNRWFLGAKDPDPVPQDASGWMLLYAVLATVYRWGLTLLILYVVSIMLRPYGLESVGRLLCVAAAIGLVSMAMRAPIQFIRNPAKRRMMQTNRMAISAVALLLLSVVLLLPTPSGVTADGRLVPREETPLYIGTPGELAALTVDPGSMVNEGDTIATLTNHDVRLRYLQAEGRYETQKDLVDSIKRSRFKIPEAANELPSAQALLEDLDKQLATRKERLDGLELKSPATGRVVAVARLPQATSSPDPREYRLVTWDGYPTDEANRGCFLESGVELVSIVTDDRWDAELLVNQTTVQRIKVGNKVKLVLESNPSEIVKGVVTEISEDEWNANRHAPRQDDPNSARGDQPLETSYVVRVELDEAPLPMINGATVSTRIEAERISVLGRANRALSRVLRFR